jgi:hypothetical protein
VLCRQKCKKPSWFCLEPELKKLLLDEHPRIFFCENEPIFVAVCTISNLKTEFY